MWLPCYGCGRRRAPPSPTPEALFPLPCNSKHLPRSDIRNLSHCWPIASTLWCSEGKNTHQTQTGPAGPSGGMEERRDRAEQEAWASSQAEQCPGQWGDLFPGKSLNPGRQKCYCGIGQLTLELRVKIPKSPRGRIEFFLSILLSKHMNFPSVWTRKYLQFLVGIITALELTKRSETGIHTQQQWHSKWNKWALGHISALLELTKWKMRSLGEE